MGQTTVVGFRINPAEAEKLQALTTALQCQRSEVLRHLIRAASDAKPASVKIEMAKTNRRDAQALTGQRVTTVSA